MSLSDESVDLKDLIGGEGCPFGLSLSDESVDLKYNQTIGI